MNDYEIDYWEETYEHDVEDWLDENDRLFWLELKAKHELEDYNV